MSTVIFDASTLMVKAIDRLPLSHEVKIDNVDLTGLTKQIQYSELQPKKTTVTVNGASEQKQLYLLPVAPLQQTSQVTKQVETTSQLAADGVTKNTPVMITETTQQPLLDSSGKPITYQPVSEQQTTQTKDYYGNPTKPIMQSVTTTNSNGTTTTTQVQETDANGNLLYTGLMANGSPLQCFTTVESQVQKTDANGNKVYLENVTENVTNDVPQPDKEITDDDSCYVDGLSEAMESVNKTRTANFLEEMELFSYQDIVAHKQSTQPFGFFSASSLYETFQSVFTNQPIDMCANVASFAPNATATTVQLTLPKSATLVHILTETNDTGLQVSIGSSLSDLQALDSNNERLFSSAVFSIYLKFTNTASKRIDLKSLSILV